MRHQMTDGTIVDTDRASATWGEDTYWDGSNMCSLATGSQWAHERLYRSRRGRYYVLCWSQWQGSRERCEWVSEHEAARWLMRNNRDLPDDLAPLRDEIEE